MRKCLARTGKYLSTHQEWDKAIEVGERYRKLTQQTENIALSHYYCEFALESDQQQQIMASLTKALIVSPNCVRATLILAEQYAKQNNYEQAIKTLEQIAEQNLAYISEALPPLIKYYHICRITTIWSCF